MYSKRMRKARRKAARMEKYGQKQKPENYSGGGTLVSGEEMRDSHGYGQKD